MGRRTLLLIASILVAALGTSLIWLYVQDAESTGQRQAAVTKVLMLTGDFAAGVAGKDLRTAVVDATGPLADGALTSLAPVQNLHLASGVVAGEILRPTMFTTAVTGGVNPNDIYVSITIADPHRIPARLQEGENVAIYLLANGTAGTNNGFAGLPLVVRSAHVASLGPSPAAVAGQQVPGTLVGFQVSPNDAERILAIEQYGQPVLALPGTTATVPGTLLPLH